MGREERRGGCLGEWESMDQVVRHDCQASLRALVEQS